MSDPTPSSNAGPSTPQKGTGLRIAGFVLLGVAAALVAFGVFRLPDWKKAIETGDSWAGKPAVTTSTFDHPITGEKINQKWDMTDMRKDATSGKTSAQFQRALVFGGAGAALIVAILLVVMGSRKPAPVRAGSRYRRR